MLKLLQLWTILIVQLFDFIICMLLSFLVVLRGNFGFIFDRDALFTDLLNFIGRQRPLFMGYHCLFNSFFLFASLLLQAKKSFFGILLLLGGVLVRIPYLAALVDAFLAVFAVVLMIGL